MYTHLSFAGGAIASPQNTPKSFCTAAATYGMIQNCLKTTPGIPATSGPFVLGSHLADSFHVGGKV